MLRGGEHAGDWHRVWRDGRFSGSWEYDPYLWSYDDSYDGGEIEMPLSSYYCSDPAGYYPAVTRCNTAWQTLPAE